MFPIDLKNSRILITNDDGYSADGIKILYEIAKNYTDDVWIVAPEHEILDTIVTNEQKKLVTEYKEKAALKSDLERTDLAKDKSGVFSGAYAINPVNNQKIPIWVSDYVLISYGSGAIMSVPAHDQRDWEFAKNFELPIVAVLEGGDISQQAFTEDGPHINSEFLNGLGKEAAIKKMIEWLEDKKRGKS